jgi:hypothetical protein
VERGGKLAANKNVPLDVYPDELARNAGQIIASAQIVRFDASDLMPSAMNEAFWKAILDYVQDPSQLDSILSTLTQSNKTLPAVAARPARTGLSRDGPPSGSPTALDRRAPPQDIDQKGGTAIMNDR